MTPAEKLQSLKEQRSAKIEAMQNLHNTAETENRSLTDAENTQWDGMDGEVRQLDSQMAKLQRQIDLNAENANNNHRQKRQSEESKMVKDYSFLRAIRIEAGIEARNGLEEEMNQEARAEAVRYGQTISGMGVPSIILQRAMSVGDDSGAKGGELVSTVKMGFIEALIDKLVLAKLGANFMTGLTGNISMPKGTAFSAAWEGETDENAETDSTITAISMSPKRVGGKALLSNQLIMQSSVRVENYVQNGLQAAIAVALQEKAINGASGGDNPVGILNTSGIGSVAIGTDGGAPTWAHLIALERELNIDNSLMGKIAFLTNAKVKAVLQQAKKDSGSGLFAWADNSINGYPAEVTNSVPSTLTKGSGTGVGVCSAIILGNWEDLILGQWGGLDLIVDKYTAAGTGQTRVIANSYWDVAVTRPESFAAIKDATTT